jgi:hypothetical protein
VEVGLRSNPGIYVELEIDAGIDDVWRLSQTPDLHERWDLRFSRIKYLLRDTESEPQRFLYETRIGFGMSIAGTGESVGERAGGDGSAISSLRFDSDDPKSLIRRGTGYWRYIPTDASMRFLTWYDYEVRFGSVGRLVDRMVFRPLLGWATAWSFDRLRLWIEEGQAPEVSVAFASIHAVARVTIAFIWLWQGLVPKLVFHDIGEKIMLVRSGGSVDLLPWLGGVEIVLALISLLTWRRQKMLLVNVALMVIALGVVALKSPEYLWGAFNPMTLNLAIIGLSLAGYVAGKRSPFAGRCLRVKPKGDQ